MHLKLSKAETSRINIFNAVIKTKSLSQAACTLGVSLSSVYSAIKKLRLLHNDVLFIRDKNQLVPTEFAKLLHTETVDLLNIQSGGHSASDEKERKGFVFSCVPHIAATVIPLTYLLMQDSNPFTLEHTVLPALAENKADLLLTNKVDVIFDYIPIEHDDIYNKRLFKEDYVIICRKGHPRLFDSVSVTEFCQEKQAALGSLSKLENMLDEKNRNNIFFCSDDYLDMLAIVEVSDMICVIPTNIYFKLKSSFNISMLRYNFKINLKNKNIYINYLKDLARPKDKDNLLKKMERFH